MANRDAARPCTRRGSPGPDDGKIGLVYEESPESQAFARWQRGKFFDVEQQFARLWREQLARMPLYQSAEVVRAILAVRETPRDLTQALDIAREAVCGAGQRYRTLKLAYALLDLDHRFWTEVATRWKRVGGPDLPTYAPYTAHCLLVDVFFYVAIHKGLISPERPSNKTDMAYLYYLPFAMMFTSNDKLHRRTAPLFMRDDQIFQPADELKTDLRALDQFYSSLPAETMKDGLFKAAPLALEHERFLTTQLYHRLGVRTPNPSAAMPSSSPKSHSPAEGLIARVKAMMEASKTHHDVDQPFSRAEIEDPDQVVIERAVPLKRGKWQFMPPGIKGFDED